MAPYTLTFTFIVQTLFSGGALGGFILSAFFLNSVYDEGVGIFPARYVPVDEPYRQRAGIAHMLLSAFLGGVVITFLGVAGVPVSNFLVSFLPSPPFACLFSNIGLLGIAYGFFSVLELGATEQHELILRYVTTLGTLYSVVLFILMLLS